ncbi:HAD family hydrolase [Phytohabitans kaempferiae]|uniref:HAD family hydrolase n=1 Tax=Phytohabitans kaempferiae TaxID=1620943 RepID=A0ABV6ME11_9ACTN
MLWAIHGPLAQPGHYAGRTVRAYLTERRLVGYVHPIIGRAFADPARMKPNPWPILAAVRELGAEPEECLLIGDSTSDVDAAQVPVIGYANKPGKRTRLAKADAIIDGMAELASLLAADELWR